MTYFEIDAQNDPNSRVNLTNFGMNYVEHDLPMEKDAKVVLWTLQSKIQQMLYPTKASED